MRLNIRILYEALRLDALLVIEYVFVKGARIYKGK